ncbi:hypothetical protein [Salinibacterium sp. SWN248]|uniref:hypothetical protein n=1 Tax=Salinibacterium sp. SWN248 TaxID=2792056 RepID=UPI0018CF00F0|nr:hypothetical protein [Salinibacterium sp. SWN248]MBH0023984.1 hypothetical protein [Salinibacterium sp. SWN248]
MGNLDDYTGLSEMAKDAGGPAELIEKLTRDGVTKGSVVTAATLLALYGAQKGASFLFERYTSKKAEEFAAAAADAIAKANARPLYTVNTPREMQRDVTLMTGDKFRALTRDGDVIMLEVDGRDYNPIFVSGAQLQQISDFKLDDLDDA